VIVLLTMHSSSHEACPDLGQALDYVSGIELRAAFGATVRFKLLDNEVILIYKLTCMRDAVRLIHDITCTSIQKRQIIRVRIGNLLVKILIKG
jgi:hypothetical protein